jgi:hypothetical protein
MMWLLQNMITEYDYTEFLHNIPQKKQQIRP